MKGPIFVLSINSFLYKVLHTFFLIFIFMFLIHGWKKARKEPLCDWMHPYVYECTLKSTSQSASFWIQLDRTFQCWKSFEKANLLGDEELSRSTLFIRLSAIARLHRRVESSMRQKMITSVGSGYVNNRFSQPLLLIDVAKVI